jgi:hypothetical protein
MTDQRGATMIEVLAAIGVGALVLLLMTIALFAAREDSRDFKRLSDMQQVRASMAAVKVQFGSFMEAGCVPGAVSGCVGGSLQQVMPTIANVKDPSGGPLCGVDCSDTCEYTVAEDIQDNSYQILFYLEDGLGQFDEKGCYELTESGISKL